MTRLKKCLTEGTKEKDLEQLIEFQLYLAARDILMLDKSKQKNALKKLSAAFHNDIRKQAKKIIDYKKTVFHDKKKKG